MAPFQPNTTNTAVLAATAATSNVALTLNGAYQVEIQNKDAANWAYCAFGTSAVTATVPTGSVGSYPVGPGQSKIVTVNPNDVTNAAVICDATKTATVFFTPGNGAS